MKKNTAIFMAALLSVCMTGCGKGEDDVVEKTNKTTTVAQTTVADTTTVEANDEATTGESETAAENNNTTETTVSAEDETSAPADTSSTGGPTAQEAEEIKNALATADRLYSGSSNMDSAYNDVNGQTFYKFDNSQFSSVSEVSRFMTEHFTQEAIDRDWAGLDGGEYSCFMDVNGELYTSIGARGGRFSLQNGEITCEKTSVDGYTLAIPNNDYGADGYVWVDVVKEGGQWKIRSFSFGM